MGFGRYLVCVFFSLNTIRQTRKKEEITVYYGYVWQIVSKSKQCKCDYVGRQKENKNYMLYIQTILKKN